MVVKITTNTGLDITEGVQVLYDMVCGSMDMSSGFFDLEEMESIVKVASVCGFKAPPIPQNSSDIWLNLARRHPLLYEVTEYTYGPGTYGYLVNGANGHYYKIKPKDRV